MPNIPEHYSPSRDTAGPPIGYEPNEAETAAIKLVEQLFTQGKKAKEPTDAKWVDQYKFFRGKQWPERRPSYRHSEVLNYIFSEVQTVLVLLTDNRPNIEVTPEDPSDLEFAEILSQILTSKWDRHNWYQVLAEAICDASIYGTAIASVEWNAKLAQGLGDFTFETEDVFHIFPDPNAKSRINDEHCDWVIRARPTAVRKLKAKYPDKADFLKSDIGDLSGDYQDRENGSEVRYKSPTDNRVMIESEKSVRPHRSDEVLELCLYLKSDELVEEQIGESPEPDPETGIKQKLYQTRKKYPTGRKIVVANGVLLEDGPNPYESGDFPFARLVDHGLPREFWGIGEVENLRSPQMIVNKLTSYVLDVLTIMGNPIWVVDTTSMVDTDNLTNQPGLVVEKAPGSEVRREEGVELQPYVMQVLEFMSERVLSKLGSTADVSKGVAPAADSSGYAIAQLQEAAQTKIRGKGRNVEMFLKEAGNLMVDRVLQFYQLPRVERITNNTNAAEYFKFHITEVQDMAGAAAEVGATVPNKIAHIVPMEQATDPMTGEKGGPYVEGAPIQIPIKSKLDVKINVGSSLPFAKLENRQMAENLFEKGIIDVEEYLKQIDYPNRDKILQKLRSQPPAPPQQGAPNAAAAPAAIPAA
jgi:hypothetical protein